MRSVPVGSGEGGFCYRGAAEGDCAIPIGDRARIRLAPRRYRLLIQNRLLLHLLIELIAFFDGIGNPYQCNGHFFIGLGQKTIRLFI